MWNKLWALYKKEISIIFSMPIAYAVISVFAVLSGYFFANIANYYALVSLRSMNQYQRMMMELSMIEGIFRPYFHNVVVIMIIMFPLITMRLFAEEKREGTVELLFTYPVSDLAIVLSKFFAALTVFAAMLGCGVVSFLIFRVATQYEILPVLSGFLGLLLVGAAFIALGLFISSLTESQIVAAVISFGVLLLFLVLPWLSQSVGPEAGKVIMELSIVEHFDSFAKGLFDTSDIVYYFIFIFLFLFLTLRILETKQWRG
jgi:ABC-2 type transport system permease protein